jgi:hypothetical protein
MHEHDAHHLSMRTMVYSFRRRLALLVLVLSLGGLGACDKTQSEPQVEAVREFYNWRIDSQVTGVPSSAELSEMSPYLSSQLHRLLEASAADYPDIQPAQENERTIEHGDWFTSMFDGPTSFIISSVEPSIDGHVISVRFTSAKQLPSVNWRDRITVVQENGRYVIANVEFENHWMFRDDASLVDALKNPKARRKQRS